MIVIHEMLAPVDDLFCLDCDAEASFIVEVDSQFFPTCSFHKRVIENPLLNTVINMNYCHINYFEIYCLN